MALSSTIPDQLILWLKPSDPPMLPLSLLPYLRQVYVTGPGRLTHQYALQHQFPTIQWFWHLDNSTQIHTAFTLQAPLWWYRPHPMPYQWKPQIFHWLAQTLQAEMSIAIQSKVAQNASFALNPFNRLETPATPSNRWHALGMAQMACNMGEAYLTMATPPDLSYAIPPGWDVAGIPLRRPAPVHVKRAVFIDRDGVLNRRLPGDYVKKTTQFEWLPNTWKAVRRLSERFDYLFIVTNQQGIGKGLMAGADLDAIHSQMLDALHESKGRVDGVYSCPGLSIENPPCRKPNTGMAWQARSDFPDFDWDASWMVGDSLSDLEFGLRLGLSVGAIMEHADPDLSLLADRVCPDLYAFARSFRQG